MEEPKQESDRSEDGCVSLHDRQSFNEYCIGAYDLNLSANMVSNYFDSSLSAFRPLLIAIVHDLAMKRPLPFSLPPSLPPERKRGMR